GKLEATGDRVTLDGCDHGLGQQQSAESHRPVALLVKAQHAVWLGQGLEIGAGTESASGTGQDCDSQRFICVETPKGLGEGSGCRSIDGIAHLPAIKGNHCDRSFCFHPYLLAHSTWIARASASAAAGIPRSTQRRARCEGRPGPALSTAAVRRDNEPLSGDTTDRCPARQRTAVRRDNEPQFSDGQGAQDIAARLSFTPAGSIPELSVAALNVVRDDCETIRQWWTSVVSQCQLVSHQSIS